MSIRWEVNGLESNVECKYFIGTIIRVLKFNFNGPAESFVYENLCAAVLLLLVRMRFLLTMLHV